MAKSNRASDSLPAAATAPRWWWQVTAIVGLSSVLGLAFNANNPVGIRLGEPPMVTGTPAAKPGSAPVPPVAPPVVTPSPAQPVAAAPPPSESPAPTVTAMASPATWREIKPLAAQGQAVLVDARPKGQYEAGHIPGAILLTEPPGPEELAAFQKQYPTNTHLVVYCSSTSCSLSFRLANRLVKESGYTFVQYITGGYLEYQREEHSSGDVAVTSSATNGSPTASPATSTPPPTTLAESGSSGSGQPASAAAVSPNPTRAVGPNAFPLTWGQVQPMVGTSQIVLLDARPRTQFDAGHIPGALSLPENSPADAFAAVLKAHPADTRFVAYCAGTGCSEAFRLANRLIREHGATNAHFLIEGYTDWQRLNPSAMKPQTAKQ